MLYRQEGELVPFTAWPWMRMITRLDKKYFFVDYNCLYAYFKKDYLWVYWDLEAMNRLSSSVHEKYKNNIDEIYLPFTQKAQELETFYTDTFEENIKEYSNPQLKQFIKQLWKKHTAMWSLSIFIDSFDPGIDQQEIGKITAAHSLSDEETAILLTPTELTFVSERWLEFYGILRTLAGKTPPEIARSTVMKNHIQKFDYYQYSYSHVHHLTQKQIRQEVKALTAAKIETEFQKLYRYSAQQDAKIQRVLRQHRLNENPLAFFQQLTYWREHRKKVNLMGVHIWHRIFGGIATRTGIKKEYLEYLNYDEFEKVFDGAISAKVLQERYEQGVMLKVEKEKYQLWVGKKALLQKQQCEQKIKVSSKELTGQIACKGIAQGRVKIVMSRKDFVKFKEGDILVAGMTRPEHVPLMKKAAAIVTNEGGITCHAAIVSRELGKPCIIGTKVATEVLKDGMIVIVDAEKGTIQILSPINILPKESYHLSFKIKGMSILMTDLNKNMFQELNPLFIIYNNIYYQFFPLEKYNYAKEKGVELFGNKVLLQKYEGSLEQVQRDLEKMYLEIKESNLTKRKLEEFLDLCATFCRLYGKMNSEYTDKAYVLQNKNKDLKQNLTRIIKLKDKVRSFLNRALFEKEGFLAGVLEIMSKKVKITVSELENYTRHELLNLFDGQRLDKKVIEERRDAFVIICNNGTTKQLQGKEAKDIALQFQDKKEDITEIKGQCANPGKVRGKVRIIPVDYSNFGLINQEMENMKQGEILVAETTAPELMMACRKAAAIVTDLGGMLSHAAIVSRELHIPCIVGCKKATLLLKTGDIIEMDAQEGIIRKIKN